MRVHRLARTTAPQPMAGHSCMVTNTLTRQRNSSDRADHADMWCANRNQVKGSICYASDPQVTNWKPRILRCTLWFEPLMLDHASPASMLGLHPLPDARFFNERADLHKNRWAPAPPAASVPIGSFLIILLAISFRTFNSTCGSGASMINYECLQP